MFFILSTDLLGKSLLKIVLLENQSCMKWACIFLTVEMCCVELNFLFRDVYALFQCNFMARIMVLLWMYDVKSLYLLVLSLLISHLYYQRRSHVGLFRGAKTFFLSFTIVLKFIYSFKFLHGSQLEHFFLVQNASVFFSVA